MNMQLVLAKAALENADVRWRTHRRSCPKCVSAQRSRKREQMCQRGGQLYDDWKACTADVAEQKRLDDLPIPGQGELFTQDEIEEMRRK